MKTKLFHKNFTLLIIGQFISLFGNSLQRFSLSLLILDLTGSAAVFSLILAITFLPQIFIAPFGGAIADRFSKQKIMVFLDLFSGVFLLLFTLLFFRHSSVSMLTVAVLMCLLSIIQSIYEPSVRAAIPAVTSPKYFNQANSAVSVVTSLTALSGPVAAGFLYGLSGVLPIFIINIISFLCSAIMELFLVIPDTKKKENISAAVFLSDLRQTFSYLTKEKPVILQMIFLSCSFNLFLTPIYTVGFPFVEKIILGVSNELYGISEGFAGAGMIAGALLTGFFSKKMPFTKLYVYFTEIIFLVLGMGFCTLPFLLKISGASYLPYVLFTAFGFLFAVLTAIINILCMTYMQFEIPIAFMGKSMALITALSTALMPVGQIVFGGLYDMFSSAVWILYLIVAIICTLLTVVTYYLIQKAVSNGSLTISDTP